MRKKILFITSNFERTGSEMLLWYFMSNLNKKMFETSLFSKFRGALIENLPKEVPYFIAYKNSKNTKHKLLRGILKLLKINPLEYQMLKIQKKIKADVWYINTIVNPEFYTIARKVGVKIITHFHELPMAYTFIRGKEMDEIINKSDEIVGCSKIVCEKVKEMGHKNVHLLYGFIDSNKIKINREKLDIRNKLGIDNNEFVWAISGKTTLTKGVDAVIPVLERLPSNFKLLWIGGEEDDGLLFYVKKVVERRFSNRVLFIGAQNEDYYDYLNCSDAFLLLSREDSFPLVMLEAAALGKPIVGFDSGGIKEFVQENMGIVVEKGDISGLVEAMIKVQVNSDDFPEERIKKAVEKYTVKNQIPIYEQLLNEIS